MSRITDTLHRLSRIQRLAGTKPPIAFQRVLLFALSSILSLVTSFLLFQLSSLSQEAIYMTGIFVLAALLWATEALPLFATAILVIALEIILLANPGGWTGFGFVGGTSPDYPVFLAPLANPVIVLFFGGFLLAHAILKEGVDKAMAGAILTFFGSNPRNVMLGLMLITAVFSMWMSNTATTAMMITLTVPMLSQIPVGDPLRKGLILSVPFAANIGGMGTPIASPPNAVAVSFLLEAGYEISFLQWVLIATPLMAGLLLFAWGVLLYLYPPGKGITFAKPVAEPMDGRDWYVVGVLVTTIGLWLTEGWHGLSTAVVALLPAVAFTATGLLTRRDVNSLEWHILILIMGGIALGVGMQQTGLDAVFVSLIPSQDGVVLGAMVIATILFSTFISNTAAANLLLPIGIAFAAGTTEPGSPGAIVLAVSIALAASLAMSLPVSTPPNTIAYSQGRLTSGDFIRPGVVIGIVAVVLIVWLGDDVVGFWMSRSD